MAKKPKPYKMRRFGILNPWGDIWTHNTFDTSADAYAYIAAFLAKSKDHDTSKFEVAPVDIVVTAADQ